MPMVLSWAALHVQWHLVGKAGYSFPDSGFCCKICRGFSMPGMQTWGKSEGLGIETFWNRRSSGVEVCKCSYLWWSWFTSTRVLFLSTGEVVEDLGVLVRFEMKLCSHWTQWSPQKTLLTAVHVFSYSQQCVDFDDHIDEQRKILAPIATQTDSMSSQTGELK